MMLNNSLIWILLRGLVLSVWIALLLIAFVIPGGLMNLARIALLVLFLIHLGEIPLSISIGKEKKLSKARVFIKTVVFGFTWWIPLRKGIIRE